VLGKWAMRQHSKALTRFPPPHLHPKKNTHTKQHTQKEEEEKLHYIKHMHKVLLDRTVQYAIWQTFAS